MSAILPFTVRSVPSPSVRLEGSGKDSTVIGASNGVNELFMKRGLNEVAWKSVVFPLFKVMSLCEWCGNEARRSRRRRNVRMVMEVSE